MVAAIIAPSILSADLARLRDECDDLLKAGAHWLHLDVMDGHFVNNLTFGPPAVKCLRKNLPDKSVFLDVHAMVTDPAQWLQPMADAGANQYTFHLETLKGGASEAIELAEKCKNLGMRAGLALKPGTPLDKALPALKSGKFQLLLIMTVEPGFGGQKFIMDCVKKVKDARQSFPDLDIQVDGGVNLETAKVAAEAGANAFVAGTFIVSSDDRRDAIEKLKKTVS